MKHRIRKGVSMVEALVAATITVMVIGTSVGTFMQSMNAWATGQGMLTSETETQQSMREISQELREAMTLTVDADGKGVSYQYPLKDSGGNFITPIQWDGISRRAYITANSSGSYDLYMGRVGAAKKVARQILITDPERFNASVRVFTAGMGTVTRQVTVELVSRARGKRNKIITKRAREVLFLRNVPVSTH